MKYKTTLFKIKCKIITLSKIKSKLRGRKDNNCTTQ